MKTTFTKLILFTLLLSCGVSPGLLPAQQHAVDAAFHLFSDIYFIKGDSIAAYDDLTWELESGYPEKIDYDWQLSSLSSLLSGPVEAAWNHWGPSFNNEVVFTSGLQYAAYDFLNMTWRAPYSLTDSVSGWPAQWDHVDAGYFDHDEFEIVLINGEEYIILDYDGSRVLSGPANISGLKNANMFRDNFQKVDAACLGKWNTFRTWFIRGTMLDDYNDNGSGNHVERRVDWINDWCWNQPLRPPFQNGDCDLDAQIEDDYCGYHGYFPFEVINAPGTSPGNDVVIETVKFHIPHENTRDLIIRLVSPSGVETTLLERVGAGNDFGWSCSSPTTLTDASNIPISSGFSPFTGSYKPTAP